MNWPRMTLQRQMVAVAILAILIAGGGIAGPDFCRRWAACWELADWSDALLPAYDPDSFESDKEQLERIAKWRASQQRHRVALFLPWRVYDLVE